MKRSPNWSVVHCDQPQMLVVQVIQCQTAWSWLTKKSRQALVQLADDPNAEVHPLTLRTLRKRGLVENDTTAVMVAGRRILKWRPKASGEDVAQEAEQKKQEGKP